MIYSDVETEVYRLLKDPQKAAFPTSTIARGITSAVRRVLSSTNTACAQTTLSMVLGTSLYTLPSGIRRITKVRLVPATAGEPKELTQYYMNELPITSPTTQDPIAYAILSGQDSAVPEQMSINFWPVPIRSAVGAFIIDYEVGYVFTSSSGTAKIYISENLTDCVAWFAAADVLVESDDVNDIQKSEVFRNLASRKLADNYLVETLSLRSDKNRCFP